ncbi:hypothetical protein BJP40_02375 [Streptomyces sp. CC53]|uniref:hypothetical protein n=1 Tax=Streptomyces sp. CC53 TaxID=1906740 RepID=UPI0008DDDD49|nr:hypothetical protein [Streptomyces sp. CC53]OII64375.1 hypothetical protein BJP40_02375 [Streptomyces sp. CC53]
MSTLLLALTDEAIDQADTEALRREFSLAMPTTAATLSVARGNVALKLVQRLPVRDRWDDADRREALRVMRSWLQTPKLYRARYTAPGRERRPSGPGQMTFPTRARYAAGHTACALCGDPVATGDLIGRIRDKTTPPYVALGWACRHCLYHRRAAPRRIDLVTRIFHDLFASTGVGLNPIECERLLEWIEDTPDITSTTAWKNDPLDNTLVRMRTSVKEQKLNSWFSVTTGQTLIAALHEATATRPTREEELLRAVLQHTEEWQTNACGVDTRLYGSGPRYRQAALKQTPHPTVLSRRGGPFYLHQAAVTPPEVP